jgi:hypothetical protein
LGKTTICSNRASAQGVSSAQANFFATESPKSKEIERFPGGAGPKARQGADLKRFQIESFLIFTLHSCPAGAPLLTENP